MKRLISLILLTTVLSSCGDFPEYRYNQSEEYCVLSIPFAAGLIGRKYIGYFYLTSTLQFLDAEPKRAIFIGEPSNIELEPGSVQKIEIGDKEFYPKFEKNYLQGELQYWGPALILGEQDSEEIYHLMQEGHNLVFHGRMEVGRQYETELYNFNFDDANEPFESCINRLLDKSDIQTLKSRKN